MFGRKAAPGVRSECQKAGNEFGVDPIGLDASSKAACECLDLGRSNLSGLDTGAIEHRPESPFQPSGRLKACDGIAFFSELRHDGMTSIVVCQSKALAIGQTMDVKPIAAHFYPDDPPMSYILHALLLLVRGPATAASNCSRQ